MRKQSPIENRIYASIIELCEEKESNGTYIGNGHHLAQNLCVKISEALLPKQQMEIYAVMSLNPQTSKEIGIKCNLPSKNVSTQLKQMYDNTLLISFKNKGRIKLWSRKC
jgi:hypothetical protein